LLINKNLAKCCHLILSTYVYFLTFLFYDQWMPHPSSTHTCSLSLALSWSLSYLVLVPPFLFWYKTDWILCLDYQLNKCFSIARCSHFKGNINTKSHLVPVAGSEPSALEYWVKCWTTVQLGHNKDGRWVESGGTTFGQALDYWSISRGFEYSTLSAERALDLSPLFVTLSLVVLIKSMSSMQPMEQCIFKIVNNSFNANIHSYIETSGGQSKNPYLNFVHFFNNSVN
jgi:hypothetical protein